MTVAELIDRPSELPPDGEVFLIEDPRPGRLVELPATAGAVRQVVRGLDGKVVIAGG